MPGRLVRLRADPSKVRVSLRHVGEKFGMDGDWYRVTVLKSNGIVLAWYEDPTPEIAIIRALEEATDVDCTGIDLGMDRAYPHPWLDRDPRGAAS